MFSSFSVSQFLPPPWPTFHVYPRPPHSFLVSTFHEPPSTPFILCQSTDIINSGISGVRMGNGGSRGIVPWLSVTPFVLWRCALVKRESTTPPPPPHPFAKRESMQWKNARRGNSCDYEERLDGEFVVSILIEIF